MKKLWSLVLVLAVGGVVSAGDLELFISGYGDSPQSMTSISKSKEITAARSSYVWLDIYYHSTYVPYVPPGTTPRYSLFGLITGLVMNNPSKGVFIDQWNHSIDPSTGMPYGGPLIFGANPTGMTWDPMFTRNDITANGCMIAIAPDSRGLYPNSDGTARMAVGHLLFHCGATDGDVNITAQDYAVNLYALELYSNSDKSIWQYPDLTYLPGITIHIPEPGAVGMMLAGAMWGMRRRRQK